MADESSTFLEFVVSLSAPSTQAVSVSYNNSNITAANGSDYFALTSTLTFAPGETTKVVKIPVLDTAGVEPTEVMTLNLFSAVNATIAPSVRHRHDLRQRPDQRHASDPGAGPDHR